jgi:hypothetical protein
MLRLIRTAVFATVSLAAAPAFAAPPAVDAQVLLVRPNQSGQVPQELASMRRALQSKGYSGAAVDARRSVRLEANQTQHVQLGVEEVDLTLLSVEDGQARVRFAQHGKPERVTTVSTDNTRFFVTVPMKSR